MKREMLMMTMAIACAMHTVTACSQKGGQNVVSSTTRDTCVTSDTAEVTHEKMNKVSVTVVKERVKSHRAKTKDIDSDKVGEIRPRRLNVKRFMRGVGLTTFLAEREIQPSDKKPDEWRVDCKLLCHITTPNGVQAGKAVACMIEDYVKETGMSFEMSMDQYHGTKDSIQAIALWTIDQFQKIYKDYLFTACEPLEEDFGRALPGFFNLDVFPVWMNEEKTLITFQIGYSYDTTGVHGMYGKYYMTYDLKKDKVVGWEDLIRKERMLEVCKMIDKQVHSYKIRSMSNEREYKGEIDEGDVNVHSLLVEKVRNAYYPRPALVGSGLVFSYQPYWIASFAEGDLHFIIDYKDLESSLISPKIYSN